MAHGTGVANIFHDINVNYESFIEQLVEFLGEMASEYIADTYCECEVDESYDTESDLRASAEVDYSFESYSATRESPAEFSTSIEGETDIEPCGAEFMEYLLKESNKEVLFDFLRENANNISFNVTTEIEY